MIQIWIVVAIVVLAIVVVTLWAFSLSVARRVEAELPPQGKFIDIGQDRLHYIEQGSGPAVVLIHGLGGQSRNFAYLDIAALARNHRVVIVDRPGAGYSIRASGSDASISAQARTFAALFKALGIESAVVVGHSLGGAVALALALHHPEQVRRLALIAPLTHAESDPPPAFKALAIRSRLVRRWVSRTLAVPLSIRGSEAVLKIVFGPDVPPKDFPKRGGGLLGLRPVSFFEASTDLVAIQGNMEKLEALYPSLRIPVDVLFGKADQILSHRKHGIALEQKIDGLRLKLVDGGHMLPVTSADMTTRWLLDVLEESTVAS
jgi:pimeloyl-ACP methyl ester carboxylesterase